MNAQPILPFNVQVQGVRVKWHQRALSQSDASMVEKNLRTMDDVDRGSPFCKQIPDNFPPVGQIARPTRQFQGKSWATGTRNFEP
jgi:hypothetical protein